ncbi:hypothetical protein [Rhodococcus pyridinivorans]
MIAHVLIPIIGAGGAGLILLLGWLWRIRYFLIAIGALVAVAVGTGGFVWLGGVARDAAAVPPMPPTMEVLSWGERDMHHMDDNSGEISLAHLVYATVAITAGSDPISVPDIFDPAPQHLVWLAVADDGRVSDTIRYGSTPDGEPLAFVPSHDDELVREFGGPFLPIPGPQCTDLSSGQRCETTLTWWFYGTGPVARIDGITLISASVDPTRVPPDVVVGYERWPSLAAEEKCSGVMEQWCS